MSSPFSHNSSPASSTSLSRLALPRKTRKSIVGLWQQNELDGHAENLPAPLDLDRVKSTVRRKSIRRESVRWEEDDEEDPLHLQLEYLRCIIDQYPNDAGPVLSTMESILERFKKDQRYHGDVRYLKVWVAYCNLVRDPDCVYEYLERTNMFTALSAFYEAWSECLERDCLRDAIDVVNLGIERNAQPLDRLEKRLAELTHEEPPVVFTVYEEPTPREPLTPATAPTPIQTSVRTVQPPIWQPGNKEGTIVSGGRIMCHLAQCYPSQTDWDMVAVSKIHEVTFEELRWSAWQKRQLSEQSDVQKTPPQRLSGVIGDFQTPTKTRDGKSDSLVLFPRISLPSTNAPSQSTLHQPSSRPPSLPPSLPPSRPPSVPPSRPGSLPPSIPASRVNSRRNSQDGQHSANNFNGDTGRSALTPLHVPHVRQQPKGFKSILTPITECNESSVVKLSPFGHAKRNSLPPAVFCDEEPSIDPWCASHAVESVRVLIQTKDTGLVHHPKEQLDSKRTLKNPQGIVLPFPGEWIQVEKKLSKGGMATLYLAGRKEEKTIDDVMKLLELELSRLSEPTGVFDHDTRIVLKLSEVQPEIVAHEYLMAKLAVNRMRICGMAQTTCSVVHMDKVYLYADEGWLSMRYYPYGSLLGLINLGQLDELVAVFYTIQVLKVMECLWEVGIVHGDVKPDNFLLRFGMSDWSTVYSPIGEGGWSDHGVVVCDFGRAVDLQRFPANVKFHLVGDEWDESVHCWHLRNGVAYNPMWQDFYGVACVLHSLLFGKYMQVVEHDSHTENFTAKLEGKPEVRVKEPFKRYWNVELWQRTFDLLLNPETNSDVTEELKNVRKEWETWLSRNCNRNGKRLKSLLRRVEIALLERAE